MNHFSKADQVNDHGKMAMRDPFTDSHGPSTEEYDKEYTETTWAAAQQDFDASIRMSTSVFLAVFALSATYVGKIHTRPTSTLTLCLATDGQLGSNLSGYFIGVVIDFLVPELKIGNNSSWLLMIGNLAFACVAPCAGYLQDIFGRRNALIIGSVGNILGNVLTGAANSFAMVVVGLTITGIGGAIGELTATAA